MSDISDIVPRQRWKWVRIHNVPLERYMGGGGGLKKLREELEAENAGVQVPAEIRWLSGAKARARFHRDGCGSSSVVAAILSEEVFGRLCKSGVRLPGSRHEVDAFEEERPDALCLRCGEWGYVTPTATRPRGPGVLSALRSMLRGTTVAQLRAAGWEEAICAHTLRQSARTVEVLTA